MRHGWILFPALLLASPVLGQTAAPVIPPAEVNVAPTAPTPSADLQAALDAETAAQTTATLPTTNAPSAQLQLQPDTTTPVATKVDKMMNDAESALRALQDGSAAREAEAERLEREKQAATLAKMQPPGSNQAATDALARALTDQAERAAQAAAFADAQAVEMREKNNQAAFEAATRGTFPLTPEQIKEVMRRFEDTQYAVVPPSYGQPKGEVAVTTVSLDPGAEPPEVQVAVGYVTTMAILDATGQPWPIQDIGVGGNFDVPQPEAGSHIIRISPMSRFGYGNLSVRLRDLATPVTFRVSAGNDIVHYRYDARIPRMGPNAKMSLIQKNKIVAGDDVIMSVLDNAIPAGTQKLKVTGTDKRTAAYMIGDRVFVRTPLTLLSPSWDASVSSADGTTVYELGETPVLLLSDQGQMIRAKISDDDA